MRTSPLLELTALHAGGDDGAQAAFVAIPLGDDAAAERVRQGVGGHVRHRALDVVQERVRRARERTWCRRAGAVAPLRPAAERGQHQVERPVLAEVEDFVLAREMQVEVGDGEVGARGDVAHRGLGVAPVAEDAAGRAEDGHPGGVAAALHPRRRQAAASVRAGILNTHSTLRTPIHK